MESYFKATGWRNSPHREDIHAHALGVDESMLKRRIVSMGSAQSDLQRDAVPPARPDFASGDCIALRSALNKSNLTVDIIPSW